MKQLHLNVLDDVFRREAKIVCGVSQNQRMSE